MVMKYGYVDTRTGSAQLLQAFKTHMGKHLAAYGTDVLRPKHHWAIDLPEQILLCDRVLDMFIIERIHLRIKRVAEHCKNTTRWEYSVLSASLLRQQEILKEIEDFSGGLEGRKAPWPNSQGIMVGDRISYLSNHISNGDIVFRRDACGVVLACIAESCDLYIAVGLLQHVADISPHCSKRKDIDAAVLVWPVVEVELAIAWYPAEEETIYVIRR